jgi:Prealbumin-like fold domain
MSAFRFRHRRVRRLWLLSGTFVLTAAVFLFVIASASGILSGSPSSFESNDGNMTHLTGNHDWDNVNFFHVVDVASSQADDSFVSGQKQDTTCPDIYNHGNPPKDDFTDVASFSETNSTVGSPQYHHTFLYGATIRYAANGNSSENIELKQGTNGLCTNGLLQRSLADKLIAIDYLNGGTNVQFNVLTWITSSAGYDPTPSSDPSDDIAGTCSVSNDLPPCWSSTVKTLGSNAAEGLASQATITSANDPIGNAADSADSAKFSVEQGKDLAAGQFAEFGVDLTAAGIISPNVCTAFPETVWESRSSGSSFVSTTKDVSIEDHSISNCGEIKIIKQTNPRGIDKVFSFTSGSATTSKLNANTLAGGVACTAGGSAGVDASGNFCLNDKNNTGRTLGSFLATQNDTANTVDENNLFPATYSVTEGADPTGFAFDSVTCKVNGVTTTLNTPGAPKTVTINLGVNDVVVCIYQNNQQLGAIQVSKISSKTAATALAGAHFRICTNNGPYNTGPNNDGNPCTPAKTGSGDLTTAADGTVCIGDLGFGDYYVSEKTPPTGYAADDTSAHKVTVDNNAKCSDDPYGGETIQFKDTPLTDLSVNVASEVSGGTASRISCVNNSDSANIGNSPQPADTAGTPPIQNFGDPETVTANGLHPGTYVCTVVIDP